jgi:hypothetical protein
MGATRDSGVLFVCHYSEHLLNCIGPGLSGIVTDRTLLHWELNGATASWHDRYRPILRGTGIERRGGRRGGWQNRTVRGTDREQPTACLQGLGLVGTRLSVRCINQDLRGAHFLPCAALASSLLRSASMIRSAAFWWHVLSSTASISPWAHSTPCADSDSDTYAFRPSKDLSVPVISSSSPRGVGLRKSICKEAVTKRIGAPASPIARPLLR